MKPEEIKKVEIRTYAQLLAEFDKFLLLEDRGALKAICGCVIGNQMHGDPVWLFIVGASSGGKSELIQAFNTIINPSGAPLVTPISDLTINALASGQKRAGKETSLLQRMPYGGILSFKDFTSMLAKSKEAQQEIFKQLREVYDGRYNKLTGTGDNIDWLGKVGALAGATEIIYEYQEQFAAMGDRFIMYSLVQPDRDKLVDFIMNEERMNIDRGEMRAHLQECVKSYLAHILGEFKEEEIHLSEALKNNLKSVANFCTRVRSGVVMDDRRKHLVRFVPSIEMPTRMLNQLITLAKAFIAMRKSEPGAKDTSDGNLTMEEEQILFKIAFDSIPIKRRMALKALAKYEGGVSSKGLAVAISYQTEVVTAWLAQLNGLGICSREIKGGNQGDMWKLLGQYRAIMVKFEHIEVTQDSLVDADDYEDTGWNEKSQTKREDEMVSLDPIEQEFQNF